MTTPKVLFLRGLPASGKSTYAKQLVSQEPDHWVRVNKDSLRTMLHDGKWSKGREKLVQQMQRAMAEDALKAGLSVIVDDTNFAPKHEATYRQMAEKHGAEFSILNFPANVEECIERDLKRPNPVGKDVILKMFYQSCRTEPPHIRDDLRTAVIFDMDGTLAIMNDRGAYDWEKVGNDLPNSPVIQAFHAFCDAGRYMIIVSGRDGVCRPQTEEWLRRNGIVYDELFMRPAGNTEKDTIVKQRIYDEHIKGKYNVLAVFDDRPCVVRFWRQQGLFVFDCGNGVEF